MTLNFLPHYSSTNEEKLKVKNNNFYFNLISYSWENIDVSSLWLKLILSLVAMKGSNLIQAWDLAHQTWRS